MQSEKNAPSIKKILFLSWKDIKHPEVWWAEVVLWNYIKRLQKKWYEITWVWSNFEWWEKEEIIEWVKILRVWTINNIYFKFPKYYKKNLVNKFDLIIDEAWWMPLFSTLFEKKIPIIFIIHHIWDKEWDFKYNFPLNKIWKYIFRKIIKIYKNNYTITVSNSTKEELINKFWFDKDKVFDIENALDLEIDKNIDIYDKKNEILFFGRLMPMKRAEHAILAFNYFLKKSPIIPFYKENEYKLHKHSILNTKESKENYKLNIIWPYQDWEYFESLKKLVKKLKLENYVNFTWWISLEERYKIASNKVMLFPSHKEWYWLVVLEWNIYWIPTIWYDVPWVRDSIKEWVNWFKVEAHNYEAIWEKLYEILSDKTKYNNLVKSSFEHVKNHTTWDKNTEEFEKIILKLI